LRSAIIYDDLSFFASAAARLQSVALRAEAHARWITRGWPITSLEQTATAERSLIESAEAHLIILPCRHAGRLPRCLHGWLTRWAGMRAIAEAAVAVLWDCGEMHSTWDVSPELIAFVRLHGLNFILEGDPNLGDEPQATQTSGECKTGLPANNIHLL